MSSKTNTNGTEPLGPTPRYGIWCRFKRNRPAVFGSWILAIVIVLSAIGPVLFGWLTGISSDYIPSSVENGALVRSFPPSLAHPMGADDLGRDLFLRVFEGGRISILVGIFASVISLLIGVAYGATAGFFGGRIDGVMMRIVDMLFAIPYLLIVVVMMSLFGGNNAPNAVKQVTETFVSLTNALMSLVGVSPISTSSGLFQIFFLFVALGSVSWLTMARIVRGQVLSLKNEEFILAARSIGVSTFGIVFRHLIPNISGPVIVYATLTIPSVMLAEAFLSFLGLGVQAPYSSWGSLAADGIKNIAVYPWQLVFPGLVMGMTLVALNLIGDGLRDAFDPKSSKS